MLDILTSEIVCNVVELKKKNIIYPHIGSWYNGIAVTGFPFLKHFRVQNKVK